MIDFSFSDLKHMALSPAHFLYRLDHGIKRTSALRRGTAVHREVLGLPAGSIPTVVWSGSRRGALWDAFERHNRSAAEADVILTETEWTQAVEIANAVKWSEKFAVFMNEGTVQLEVPMRYELLGMPFRTRGIDILQQGRRRIADLKTVQSADPRALEGNSARMFWQVQLAMYSEACRQNGIEVVDHAVIAVEVNPPYPVTILEYDHTAIEEGTKIYTGWAETLKGCLLADHWPEYTQAPHRMTGFGPALEGLDQLEEVSE